MSRQKEVRIRRNKVYFCRIQDNKVANIVCVYFCPNSDKDWTVNIVTNSV
jgi:hypothetical protein